MNVHLPGDFSFAQASGPGVLQVNSLAQVDELIGRYVTGVSPAVYWEDTCTQWRFETLAEGLEAMRDPFFAAFAPENERCRSSLREVHEYPACSTELETAMAVVEQLSAEAKPLTLWQTPPRWTASFPGGKGIETVTPALAICLAALRTRGLEVIVSAEALAAAAGRTLRMGSLAGEAATPRPAFRQGGV